MEIGNAGKWIIELSILLNDNRFTHTYSQSPIFNIPHSKFNEMIHLQLLFINKWNEETKFEINVS